MDENNPWVKLAKMSGQAKKPVELDEVLSEKSKNAQTHLVLQDERSAGGKKKNQNEWIKYYSQDDEWDFPSSAQYYQIFKQIRKERNQTLLKALRQDWKDYCWINTSTRIQYLPDSVFDKIVHNYGSDHEKKIEVSIPIYEGVYLNQISDQLEAETYLQALFDTQDNFDKMVDILEYASGKSMEDIILWSPIQLYRTSRRPEKSVYLRDGDTCFRVGGDDNPYDGYGFSRGVREQRVARSKLNKNCTN